MFVPPTTVSGDLPTGAGRPRLPPSPWSWIRSCLVEISGPPLRPCASRIPNSLAASRLEANVAWRLTSGLRCLAHEGPPARPASLGVMTATLCGPGGVRAVIAEHLLLKQQLIVLAPSSPAGATPDSE